MRASKELVDWLVMMMAPQHRAHMCVQLHAGIVLYNSLLACTVFKGTTEFYMDVLFMCCCMHWWILSKVQTPLL